MGFKKRLKKQFKFSLIFLISLFFTCLIAYEKNISKEYLVYKETSNLNYLVCYVPNNELNQGCLPQSINNYVTKYIDKIKPSFSYKLSLNKNVNIAYKYKITGELTIFDRNNHSLIMEKKNYELLNKKKELIENTDEILINELLDLDYKKYEQYVINYKTNASVSASANLKLLLHIESINKYHPSSEDIKINEDIILNIPLDEQTIQLSTNFKPNYQSSNIEIVNNNVVLNIIFLVLLGLTTLFGLMLIIFIIKSSYKKNKTLPIYDKLIKDLKNDFNYEISEISTLIDSDNEDQYLYLDVVSFKELFDLIKTSIEKKIFWNEKLYIDKKNRINNRISWFFVFLSDKQVARFIVDENKLNEEYLEDEDILKKYKG